MIACLETAVRETGGDPVECFPERSIGGSLPSSVPFLEKGGTIFEFPATLFDEGGDCVHKNEPHNGVKWAEYTPCMFLPGYCFVTIYSVIPVSNQR
jgi:hypothetical protein